MTSRIGTSLHVFGAALFFSLQPVAAGGADEPDWHIGLKAGPSYATGMVGIELQRGRFAAAAGAFCFAAFGATACVPTTALKYYLNETGPSWAMGVFHWWWNDDGDRGTFSGVGAEYRWYLSSGWDLTLGLGVGRVRDDDDDFTAPFPSLTFGYSF